MISYSKDFTEIYDRDIFVLKSVGSQHMKISRAGFHRTSYLMIVIILFVTKEDSIFCSGINSWHFIV